MVRLLIILAFVSIIGFTFFKTFIEKQPKKITKMTDQEEVTLNTKDGFTLKGTYYHSSSQKGIILLHMLQRDRSDWSSFASKLKDNGFNVLSIDSRGHGKSSGDWQKFTDTEFNGMVNDVEASLNFLKEKGNNSIGIVGASIGANTALNAAVSNQSNLKTIVLLSPGLDYHGVKIKQTSSEFTGSILIAVAKDDTYAYQSSQEIYNGLKTPNKKLITYESGGHGTLMLSSHPELENEIINFFKLKL